MIFIPQKSVPSKTDKWYIRTNKGGYSQCIQGKPEYFSGSVLSNCVGYAWGRVAYLENDKKCDIGVPPSRIKKGMHNPTSAYAWMMYTGGRKTGKSAKLGATAVWKHKTKVNYGHVAVVEEVYSDGSWLSSESSYNGTTFQNKKYNNQSYKANFTFLGFIYCRVDYEQPTPQPSGKFKVGDYVEIIGNGNSKSDGKGATSKGIGLKRYINKIVSGAKFPNDVGLKNSTRTGYYPDSSLRLISSSTTTQPSTSSLKVGDKVKIIAKGNAKKDGKGKASGGVGWTRYILEIYNGQPYPYKIGNKLGVATGYYKASALKKV